MNFLWSLVQLYALMLNVEIKCCLSLVSGGFCLLEAGVLIASLTQYYLH